jgi:hypothetical protein
VNRIAAQTDVPRGRARTEAPGPPRPDNRGPDTLKVVNETMIDVETERKIQARLRELIARPGKVTDRDLMRISAQTGVDYMTVRAILEGMRSKQVGAAR